MKFMHTWASCKNVLILDGYLKHQNYFKMGELEVLSVADFNYNPKSFCSMNVQFSMEQ